MPIETNIADLELRETKQSFRVSPSAPRMDIGARTDSGCVRENNEDCFLVAPEMNLFVVSDGMGGLARGEVASRLTVDALLTYCQQREANAASEPLLSELSGISEASESLLSAVELANRVVYRSAEGSEEHHDMGATVVALCCVDDRVSIAHVGDSRAYRLRNGSLEQLTDDHSFVAEQIRLGRIDEEQARASGLQNLLTRAVGIEPEVQVDVREELLLDGDVLLLCSDGLTHELPDWEIAAVLQRTVGAQAAADRLVKLAMDAGGRDNITVIVLRRERRSMSALQRFQRFGSWLRGLRNPSA